MTKKYFLGFVHDPKIFSLVKKPEDIQKEEVGTGEMCFIAGYISSDNIILTQILLKCATGATIKLILKRKQSQQLWPSKLSQLTSCLLELYFGDCSVVITKRSAV